MNEGIFPLLIEEFHKSHRLTLVAKPGPCRVWTREAIIVAKDFRRKKNLDFRLEAREKELESFLLHTFLRICWDEVLYVCDGAGTITYPPFFGLESEAIHLQNSHIDPIQFYDLDDEK